MENNLLKISEIADFFGVSVKAMRLYEKLGLIIPAITDRETGYRYYSPDQIQSLNVLVGLKSLGFSLDEIKGVLKGSLSIEELLCLLSKKCKAWNSSARHAESKISEIDELVNEINNSGKAFGLSSLSDEQRAWLLSRMSLIESIGVRKVLSEALWL